MIALALAALLAAAPASPDGQLTSAEEAFNDADFEGAIKALDRLIAAGPDDPLVAKAQVLRARCLSAKGDFGGTERALGLALEADPEIVLDANSVNPQLVNLLEGLPGRLRSELRATSDKPGAEVRLDGKKLGVTPLKVQIPIGRHRLEGRSAAGLTDSRDLLFYPRRIHEVAFQFRRTAPPLIGALPPPATPPEPAKPPDEKVEKPVAAAPAAQPPPAPEGVSVSGAVEPAGSSVVAFADLRAVADPIGKGIGFEIGAGIGGENLKLSAHAVLGGYGGVTLRGGFHLPRLAGGLGAYASLDVPVVFFVPTASDGRSGGAMFGGGAALGLEYAVTSWLEPFAEVAGRYFFTRPDAASAIGKGTVLIDLGARLSLP